MSAFLASDLSVVIVTYNSAAHVRECVERLPPEAQKIVVDNASWDGTKSLLADLGVVAVQEPRNNGFARGANLGAELAEGKHLLFLNPDARPCADAIAHLMAVAATRPEFGILGAAAYSEHGEFLPRCAGHFPSASGMLSTAFGFDALRRHLKAPGHRARLGRQAARGEDAVAVDYVVGACMLVRREVWRQLGGFDEVFFMYGEDVDLCARARELGILTALAPGARCIHEGGASARSRQDMLCQLFAGLVTLGRRHGTRTLRRLVAPILMLHAGVRTVAWSVAGLASARARAEASAWKGVWRAREIWRRGYDGRAGAGDL